MDGETSPASLIAMEGVSYNPNPGALPGLYAAGQALGARDAIGQRVRLLSCNLEAVSVTLTEGGHSTNPGAQM